MLKKIRNILCRFVRRKERKRYDYIDIYKQTVLKSSYYQLKTNYKDYVRKTISPKPIKININIKSKCFYN